MPEETSVIEGEDLDGKKQNEKKCKITCGVTTDTCVTAASPLTMQHVGCPQFTSHA